MPRETSAAIGELFRGFSGYVQADAKSVYDLLFKPADDDDVRAVWVRGRAARIDVPWPEYFARLEEVALADLLEYLAEEDAELPEVYKGTLVTAEADA